MIVEIFKKAASEVNNISYYSISLDEFMLNAEFTRDAAFPAIVLFSDISTVENLAQSNFYKVTSFQMRLLFADKIETIDDTGSKILEVQERMRALSREFVRRFVNQDDFKANSTDENFTFNTDSFAHEFDADVAGVFVRFTFNLRLPINYCNYEC